MAAAETWIRPWRPPERLVGSGWTAGLIVTMTMVTRPTKAGISRPDAYRCEHLSYSALTEFSCPTAWAFSRVDGLRGPDDSRRGVGNGVHKILDLMFRGLLFTEALAAVAEGGSEDLEAIVELATRSVVWDVTSPSRPGLLATEVNMEATLDGVLMVGTADCVEVDDDGVMVVGDYKTGRAPQPVEFDEDGAPIYESHVTRQPVIYAELAGALGCHVGRVRMYYLSSQTVVEVDLDDDRGQRLRTEARRFVSYTTEKLDGAIARGFFPAKPTVGRCAGCSHFEICEFAARPDGL